MLKKEEVIPLSLLDELHTSGAGYDILRYISLPDLFGTDANMLLYFMGRNLARSLDINSLEDLYYAADKLGWGRLELIRGRKKTITFHLMADAVFHRLKASVDVDFRLEAGFIAEAIQILKGGECECVEKINRKIHLVEFTVYYTK